MKVVWSATVAVDDYKAIAEPLTDDPIEKLHISVPVLVLPHPLILVEKLGFVLGQAFIGEVSPYPPQIS